MDRDPISGTEVIISYAHHKVHAGELFNAVDQDTDVDIASPKYWMLRTPAGSPVHMAITVNASGGVLAEFFENPTITGDGTPVTPVAFNRQASEATTVLFFKDTTVSGDGTLLSAKRTGGAGVGPTKFGGEARPGSEFVLAANQDYIMKVTAVADNTQVGIEAEFYEP